MSTVYAGSSLNLAATREHERGLFSRRNPAKITPCLLPLSDTADLEKRYVDIDDVTTWKDQIEQSPLANRGWVVQERYLSPRTLYFAPDQLFWECGEGTAYEAKPWIASERSDLRLDKSGLKGKELQSNWLSVVGIYAASKLTFRSDKLIAMAGIAKQIAMQGGLGDYVAGLWRDNLELQLLWTTSYKPVPLVNKYLQYVAPSWSWALTDGQKISFTDHDLVSSMVNPETSLRIRVIDVSISPTVAGDVYGQLNSASLGIRCPRMNILASQDGGGFGEIREIIDNVEERMSFTMDDQGVFEKTGAAEFVLLQIITSCAWNRTLHGGKGFQASRGLILRPELGSRLGNYQKVGVFNSFAKVYIRDDNEAEYQEEYKGIASHISSRRQERAVADEDKEVGSTSKATTNEWKTKSYRSYLWEKLPDAPMYERAPRGDGSGTLSDDQFIITLV